MSGQPVRNTYKLTTLGSSRSTLRTGDIQLSVSLCFVAESNRKTTARRLTITDRPRGVLTTCPCRERGLYFFPLHPQNLNPSLDGNDLHPVAFCKRPLNRGNFRLIKFDGFIHRHYTTKRRFVNSNQRESACFTRLLYSSTLFKIAGRRYGLAGIFDVPFSTYDAYLTGLPI